ncbi:MAG: substrate-binding domain-containing protein [Synergistaceae bacterium]|jgi:ABC-type sugar transport system substrate-binding protein|nr:substrate-binding domain-containing protein [Synergistaceae bacterium]
MYGFKGKKLAIAVMVSLLAVVILCFAASAAETTKDYKFAMIIHDTGNSFFFDIGDGGKDAAASLGIPFDFMGPAQFDVAKQVDMFESAIQAGYAGIAFSAPDPNAFNKVIELAKSKGIPTIAFNTDAPGSGRDAFIGQDLEQSGYVLGKIMFETYMKGKGKYIITTCEPGHTALEERILGIKRAQKEFPDIELVNIINITGDMTKGYGVIENAYTANPDVNAFLGVDVYSEAIGTFINTSKLNGKVFGGGFDLTPGTLAHVKSNAMQVTLGQNPYLQGYYSVIGLYLKKEKGIDVINIDTGIEVVDGSNVDAYLKK